MTAPIDTGAFAWSTIRQIADTAGVALATAIRWARGVGVRPSARRRLDASALVLGHEPPEPRRLEAAATDGEDAPRPVRCGTARVRPFCPRETPAPAPEPDAPSMSELLSRRPPLRRPAA